MISSCNRGHFSAGQSRVFIVNLKGIKNLNNGLKSLSSEDREFIMIACRVARSQNKGEWTTLFSWGRVEPRLNTLSTKNISKRFLVVERNVRIAADEERQKTCFSFIFSIFKGIGNRFGRISSVSLLLNMCSITGFKTGIG